MVNFVIIYKNSGWRRRDIKMEFKYWSHDRSIKASSEWQTIHVKAELTPNENGYDVTLDFWGIISTGKIK